MHKFSKLNLQPFNMCAWSIKNHNYNTILRFIKIKSMLGFQELIGCFLNIGFQIFKFQSLISFKNVIFTTWYYCLSLCLSVSLSLCPSVPLSLCPSVSLSFTGLFFFLSFCLSFCYFFLFCLLSLSFYDLIKTFSPHLSCTVCIPKSLCNESKILLLSWQVFWSLKKLRAITF